MQPRIISPSARLDYIFDWAAWLGSDTIASKNITASDGVIIDSSSIVESSKAVQVWATFPAEVGTRGFVACSITTASAPARTDTRRLDFTIQARSVEE